MPDCRHRVCVGREAAATKKKFVSTLGNSGAQLGNYKEMGPNLQTKYIYGAADRFYAGDVGILARFRPNTRCGVVAAINYMFVNLLQNRT